jgi:hypothetical protein
MVGYKEAMVDRCLERGRAEVLGLAEIVEVL